MTGITSSYNYEAFNCDCSNENPSGNLSCDTLYYVLIVTFEFVEEILEVNPKKLMKAFKQDLTVVLFMVLYKVVLAFESVD